MWLTVKKSEAWFMLTCFGFTNAYPELGVILAYTMEVRFAQGYYKQSKSQSKLLPMAAMYASVVSVAPREDN